MKFLSVLLSICLCCSLSAFAMQMPEMGQPPMGAPGEFSFDGEMPQGGEFPFNDEMPEGFPEGEFQPPEMNGDGNFNFNGERPQRAPQGDAQIPENTTEEGTMPGETMQGESAQEPASESQSNEETAPTDSKRPQFQMGDGGFQPPEGGNFPGFNGQSEQNPAIQGGFLGIWQNYSQVLISVAVLLVSFVFVLLYRRRHY